MSTPAARGGQWPGPALSSGSWGQQFWDHCRHRQKVCYPISPSSPVSSWGNVERKHSFPDGMGGGLGAGDMPLAWGVNSGCGLV